MEESTLVEVVERIERLEERQQQDVEEVLEEVGRLNNRLDDLEHALETFMAQRLD